MMTGPFRLRPGLVLSVPDPDISLLSGFNDFESRGYWMNSQPV
jgi:hypothetical protein